MNAVVLRVTAIQRSVIRRLAILMPVAVDRTAGIQRAIITYYFSLQHYRMGSEPHLLVFAKGS
jgi:hypothetical protein